MEILKFQQNLIYSVAGALAGVLREEVPRNSSHWRGCIESSRKGSNSTEDL